MNAFFNPRNADEESKGINGSIQGSVADRVIQSIPEFLSAAGRDYFIKRVPAPHPVNRDEDIGGAFWLTRSSDDLVVSPKTVTKQYAPMCLLDIAAELQPWCDQGWGTPDGVYGGNILADGGESLEVLTLRLDAGDMDHLANERIMYYLAVTNPHGQGGKAKGKIIAFRPLCSNVFAALVSGDYDIAIPHRIGKKQDPQTIMQDRMERAVAGWDAARQKIVELSIRITDLDQKLLTVEQASLLTRDLFKIGNTELDDLKTRTRNRYDAVMDAFENRDAGTSGETAWDWLNAVTFYTSSPNAPTSKKSKVQPIERMIRNIDPHGTGFVLEKTATELVAQLS